MLELTSHITIGDFEFDFVNKVEIDSSWKNFTDTAKITLPKRISFKSQKLDELFKPGDPVSISLGYNWDMHEEFNGFIARSPQPTIPFVISCEDNMWKLKQGTVSASWKSATLEDVLQKIVPGEFDVDCLNADLGPFRVHKTTPAQVLSKLKETYGLVSYFKGNTLYVGKVRSGGGVNVNYDFQQNIISHQLEFKKKSEVKLKVTAISILPNNKKIEVPVGDDGGEEHTLTYYNIQSKEELKRKAEAEMSKLYYDGFRGNFEAFGSPFARHNDVAVIADKEYPERSGSYFIDKVGVAFGTEGFRRTIELGSKA